LLGAFADRVATWFELRSQHISNVACQLFFIHTIAYQLDFIVFVVGVVVVVVGTSAGFALFSTVVFVFYRVKSAYKTCSHARFQVEVSFPPAKLKQNMRFVCHC